MAKNSTKHIFVLGSSISGLGKGIVSASIGRILKSFNNKVTIQKFDPYLNISSSNIRPEAHGECIPLKDGWTGDMDLQHYINFLGDPYSLTSNNSITSGVIYSNILQNEREGKYLGDTIQVIPHVTNEIQRYIHILDKENDIVIHEIGGNIMDMEAAPYIEALRQFQYHNKDNCLVILLVYLPYLKAVGEIKTKIAQQGVAQCRSLGIYPDAIIARAERNFNESIKEKISLFTNIDKKYIIKNLNAKSIYNVPKMLIAEGILNIFEDKFGYNFDDTSTLDKWNETVSKEYDKSITIGLVCKYMKLKDCYASVIEALHFAGHNNSVNVNIHYIDAEVLETGDLSSLQQVDGILIPGGFGSRGFIGKQTACQYGRKHKIPTLGICFGAQAMMCEFAKDVLNIKDATSEELVKETGIQSNNLIVHLMDNQRGLKEMCQTLRLGDYPCDLDKNSMLYNYYKNDKIIIRHRHRYEFNLYYKNEFEKHGFHIVGTSDNGALTEIIELENHPFYIGIQGHPELLSTPGKPEPIIDAFIYCTKNN